MASGIDIPKECVEIVEEIKLRKTHAYVIFRISADWKCIEITKKGKKGETFDDFKAEMMEEDAAKFAVLDFNATNDGKGGHLAFVTWVPDSCKIKEKMVYASTKDGFRKKLQGIQVDWQLNGPEDFLVEELQDKIKKK